jgi:hypothetical protein
MLTKLKWLNSLFGRLLPSLLVLLFLASCNSFNPLSLLGKDGPSLNANVQAGALNTQTVGTTSVTEQTIKRADNSSITQTRDETKVKSDAIGNVTVNETDPLLFGALIFCFIFWSWFLYKLPSPDQIWNKKKT